MIGVWGVGLAGTLGVGVGLPARGVWGVGLPAPAGMVPLPLPLPPPLRRPRSEARGLPSERPGIPQHRAEFLSEMERYLPR